MENTKMSKLEAEGILSAMHPGMDWVDLASELEYTYGPMWDGDAEALYHEAYWTIHKRYKFGVCKGRHEMPVTDFIFDEVIDPMRYMTMYNDAYRKIPKDAEHIDLYITGLTSAVLAIVSVCAHRNITVTAWHYDKDTNKYRPQPVL